MPALEAAAARGSELVVVTDGELTDVDGLPPDLLHRPRVVVLPRSGAWDAFVHSVQGPGRISAADTVRLLVHYGSAGARAAGRRQVTLSARAAGRDLTRRPVTLPDSGVLSTELSFPAARLQAPAGWAAIELTLEETGDTEPRDDARLHVIEVSPQPHAVMLAAPPDWDSRFLAGVVEDVSGVPLRVFVDYSRSGAASWRDASTLAPVTTAEVSRALRAARLVIVAGGASRTRQPPAAPGLLRLAPAGPISGEWYVEAPPASPLSGTFAGIDWSALPPATAIADYRPDSNTTIVLTATLGRRGAARPALVLNERGGRRMATLLVSGLWRWRFRGGAESIAYRSLVAGLVDWLLASGGGADGRQRFAPVARVVPNGMPVIWRWIGSAEPRPVAVRFEPIDEESRVRTGRLDTLRFGADAEAVTRFAPGVYRYTALDDGARRETGLVAVETYSDEWRPRAAALGAQPGRPGARTVHVEARNRWWIFMLVIAAFVAEWAWRRRQGLP